MLRILPILLLVLASSVSAQTASRPMITVDRTTGTADIVARDISLEVLLRAAALRSGRILEGELQPQQVSLLLEDVPLDTLVQVIAREAGVPVETRGRKIIFRAAAELRVTLDVVQADADLVVRDLAEQCGIRNIMMQPGLAAKGTLKFEDVPCSTALRVAFDSMGIAGELHPSSVLVVRSAH